MGVLLPSVAGGGCVAVDCGSWVAGGRVGVGGTVALDEQAVTKMIVSHALSNILPFLFSIQVYLSLFARVYLPCLSVNVNVLPFPGVLFTSRLP